MAEAKITMQQYWREVSSLAKQIKKEARTDERDTGDVLNEAIDGHEWIIYTWAYPYVLMHSRNENALFDEQGAVEASDYSGIMQQMAFYALRQDVSDELGDD